MTLDEAREAATKRTKVSGGKPGTDDYDEGYITSVIRKGDPVGEWKWNVKVSWDSGVRTRAMARNLRIAR